MLWEKWPERWEAAIIACERLGGETKDLQLGAPASEAEVSDVEQQLGTRLPNSFRHVLIGFASSVSFFWVIPDGFSFPKPFHQVFSGECNWSLARLLEMKQWYEGWLGCFCNPHDPYDKVWHDKLVFCQVANGDALALDTTQATAPVVYLSHDDGREHGFVLGTDFADFVDRWTTLGCIGAEGWQMLPFLPTAEAGLDVTGENASSWKQLFGLTR